MQKKNISISIFILTVSLLLMAPAAAQAQYGKKKKTVAVPDTVPLFRGVAVSADLFGPGMLLIGDYGQYEAAVRINLRDRYFPVAELGYGKTDYVDGGTEISYKAAAPYGRLGMDFNLLKNKHDIYRLYGGVRYGFTSFNYDLGSPGVKDPVWGNIADYSAHDVKCNFHWMEVVAGVDATIWGPFHLGWSVRYRNRLYNSAHGLDNIWYVPGFGKSAKSCFGGTFNLIFEL